MEKTITLAVVCLFKNKTTSTSNVGLRRCRLGPRRTLKGCPVKPGRACRIKKRQWSKSIHIYHSSPASLLFHTCQMTQVALSTTCGRVKSYYTTSVALPSPINLVTICSSRKGVPNMSERHSDSLLLQCTRLGKEDWFV